MNYTKETIINNIKTAILTGLMWGIKVGVAICVIIFLIVILELSGMGEWDKQGELDCYKKLDKDQCQILYPDK